MRNKGMITIEACFVVPLFLFFMLGVLYLYMVLLTEGHIHQALAEAAGYTAQEAYLEETVLKDKKIANTGIINATLLNIQFGKYFQGDAYADKVIVGGKKGIVVTVKSDSDNPKIFIAKAKYHVGIHVPILGRVSIYRENQIKQKNFVGYSKEEGYANGEEYVYITPEQSVYHTRRSCTHLSLSIREISKKKNGGYEPCHFCGKKKNSSQSIYVSKTSNIYHVNKYCSGLKRTIYRVKKSEVNGLGACSRCGK